MNKGHLIDRVSREAYINKAQADHAIRALTSGITDSLRKGERMTIVGFGTFSISHRRARQGRNPRTGVTIDIPASKAVRFSAGKQLKDTVNRRKK